MCINIVLPTKKFRVPESCIKGVCKSCLDLHVSLGKPVVQIPRMFQCPIFNFRCKCIMFLCVCVYIYIKYAM